MVLVHHVNLDRAEAARERDLVAGLQPLVAKQQQLVVEERVVDPIEQRFGHRRRQIDADHLRAERRTQRPQCERLVTLFHDGQHARLSHWTCSLNSTMDTGDHLCALSATGVNAGAGSARSRLAPWMIGSASPKLPVGVRHPAGLSSERGDGRSARH